MPIRPCPQCRALAPRLLEEPSKDAIVWYYRCTSCGHVWTVSKDGKETVRDVTTRTPPAPPKDQPR
jgi:hypothetical protein